MDEDYLYITEKEHKEGLKYKSELQWLEVFPEAKSIVKEKIKEYQNDRVNVLLKVEKEGKTPDLVRELRNIEDALTKMRVLNSIYHPKKGRKVYDIPSLKLVPIDNFIDTKYMPRKTSNGTFALCPFHQETTPSFHVSNNLFHCFGCGKSGDVITFVRSLYNMTFIEALNFIQNNGSIYNSR